MKLIQVILSLLATLCAVGMLYGAITTYSPMKTFSISITSVILTGCIVLISLSYKELQH